MSRCRSCGAEVMWAQTEHGKKMPLDVPPTGEEETRHGLFVVREELGREAPLALAAVAGTRVGEEPLYTSHFATCPDAADWRRG